MCISKRIMWIISKSHRENFFFLHFFVIHSSSRHEKHGRMSERIFCLLQCSRNYQCIHLFHDRVGPIPIQTGSSWGWCPQVMNFATGPIEPGPVLRVSSNLSTTFSSTGKTMHNCSHEFRMVFQRCLEWGITLSKKSTNSGPWYTPLS